MRKAAIPALIVIIFLAFGIILAAVVIYWAINKFTEFVQGKCWADMGKAADQIKSDLASAKPLIDEKSQEVKKITVGGSCAGGIIVFNKDDLPTSGFSQVVEDTCTKSDSIKAYILVIPFKTLAEEARQNTGFFSRLSEWFTHPILSFQQVWTEGKQYILRIKPMCKTLDVPLDIAYCIPKGVCCSPSNQAGDCNGKTLSDLKMDILKNENTFDYCYKPLKVDATAAVSKTGYAYRIVEYPCTK